MKGLVEPVGVLQDGPIPLHKQVTDRIKELIATEAWSQGFQLPAEPDLARSFGVSRGTLRRGVAALTAEGLLTQVHGKGTFVTSRPIDQPLAQELLSLSEALDRQGIAYTTEVLSAGVHPVPDAIAPRLEVLPGTAVFQLHRRRAVADEPVAVLHNYVRLDRCPGIDTKDFRERQLFAVLRADFQIEIEEAARGFQAQAASKEVAEQLMIAEGVPVLYLDQVSYGKTGEPIEYSDVWIRGDKLRLSSWLVRQERR